MHNALYEDINLSISVEYAAMMVRGLDKLFNSYIATAYHSALSEEDSNDLSFASDLRAEISKKVTDMLIYGKDKGNNHLSNEV